MHETIDAIYENGVIKPLTPLAWLAEHSRVKVTIVEDKPRPPLADFVGTISDEDAAIMQAAAKENDTDGFIQKTFGSIKDPTFERQQQTMHSIRDCLSIMPDSDAKELSQIIADEFEKK